MMATEYLAGSSSTSEDLSRFMKKERVSDPGLPLVLASLSPFGNN